MESSEQGRRGEPGRSYQVAQTNLRLLCACLSKLQGFVNEANDDVVKWKELSQFQFIGISPESALVV